MTWLPYVGLVAALVTGPVLACEPTVDACQRFAEGPRIAQDATISHRAHGADTCFYGNE